MNRRNFTCTILMSAGSLAVNTMKKSSASAQTAPEEKVAAFLNAASENDVTKIEAMLKDGMDVDATNPMGETALMFGSSYAQVVKVLVAAGARVNARNKYQATALFYAALRTQMVEESDYHEGLKELIAAGADVNARDVGGRTALMYAANEGHTGYIKILLEAGADVNAQDKEGQSALTYALESERGGAAEVLEAARDK